MKKKYFHASLLCGLCISCLGFTAAELFITGPDSGFSLFKTISATSNLSGATLQYAVTNQIGECNATGGSLTFSPYTDGSFLNFTQESNNGFYICFLEGLSEYKQSATIQGIDTTAPVFGAVGPAGPILTVGDLIFPWTVTEAASLETMRFRIYEAIPPNNVVYEVSAPLLGTGPIYSGKISLNYALSGLADGDYIAEYYALDHADNITYATSSFHYTIDGNSDTTGPSITYLSPIDEGSVGSGTTFSWTLEDDSIAGGSAFFQITDDTGFSHVAYEHTLFPMENTYPVSMSLALNNLIAGHYYRHINATDMYGNMTTGDVVGFTVDRIGPTIDNTSVSGAINAYTGGRNNNGSGGVTLVTGSDFTINFEASDPCGVKNITTHLTRRTRTGDETTHSTIVFGTATNATGYVTYTNIDGNYQYYITTTDWCDNTTTGDIQAFTYYDNIAPVLTPAYIIPSTVQLANAYYYFDNDDRLHFGEYQASPISASPVTIVSVLVDPVMLSTNVQGDIRVGGTYFYRLSYVDPAGLSSNRLDIGPFTITAAPSSGGGGGGGAMNIHKDKCSNIDNSPSFYDQECSPDGTIWVSEWQPVLSLFDSGDNIIATDTGDTVTIYGFITDVFKLLHISLHRVMPAAYKTTPLSEKVYTKTITALYKLFSK